MTYASTRDGAILLGVGAQLLEKLAITLGKLWRGDRYERLARSRAGIAFFTNLTPCYMVFEQALGACYRLLPCPGPQHDGPHALRVVKEQGLEAFLRPIIVLCVNYVHVLEGVGTLRYQLPDLLLL